MTPRGHSHGSIKNNVRYNLIASFKKNKTIVEVKEMVTLISSTMLQPDIWKGKSLQRNLQIRHDFDQELPSTLFRRGNLINPVQSPPFSCCCSSAKQEARAEAQHVYMSRIIQLLSKQLFFFEKKDSRDIQTIPGCVTMLESLNSWSNRAEKKGLIWNAECIPSS